MQHKRAIPNHNIPDYDLHIPRLYSCPLSVCVASILAAGLLYILLQKHPGLAALLVGASILFGAVYIRLFAFLTQYQNLDRRLKTRDKFLKEIPWRGDETVLDVGCGNGILIMVAAKRLSTGRGIGIDL